MTRKIAFEAHDRIRHAAEGRLPEWARAGDWRRKHMDRVAGLMSDWARERDLEAAERMRWRAAGQLHDALREAPPEELRPLVPSERRGLPAPVLHGPAAAARLRADGVTDEELLRAIDFHTLGHPGFDLLGRALFCADFLEPGRPDPDGSRTRRRALFPERPFDVTFEVLRDRIRNALDRGSPIAVPTLEFWNSLVTEISDGA